MGTSRPSNAPCVPLSFFVCWLPYGAQDGFDLGRTVWLPFRGAVEEMTPHRHLRPHLQRGSGDAGGKACRGSSSDATTIRCCDALADVLVSMPHSSEASALGGSEARGGVDRDRPKSRSAAGWPPLTRGCSPRSQLSSRLAGVKTSRWASGSRAAPAGTGPQGRSPAGRPPATSPTRRVPRRSPRLPRVAGE